MLLAAAGLRPAGAEELVLEGSSNFTVPVLVNNVKLKFKVDPAAAGLVMVNAADARRASLKGSRQRGWRVSIGPVRLTGAGQDVDAVVAGRRQRLQMLWFDRDVASDADGVIGIAELPYDRVVMKLAPPRQGEVQLVFPVTYKREIGLYFPYPVLGKPIPVQFSTRLNKSVATAAAGAQIADRFSGAWAGEPEKTPIMFSVDRPVRPLNLAKPMVLHSLPVDRLFVRIADDRGRFHLPSEVSEDPDEIIVVGTIARQRPRTNVTFGRDFLSACSSLAFDRQQRTLALSCLVPGGLAPVTLSRAATPVIPVSPRLEPPPLPSIESQANRLEKQDGGAPLLEGSDQARFGLDSSGDLLGDEKRRDDRLQPDPRADR